MSQGNFLVAQGLGLCTLTVGAKNLTSYVVWSKKKKKKETKLSSSLESLFTKMSHGYEMYSVGIRVNK